MASPDVALLPIALLRDQPTVRVDGVSEDHVLVLADLSGDTPGPG